MENQLREALAAYAHDYAWARWTRYQFGKCTPNHDGSLTIPAWAVERWKRQMNTAYADLPEEERESDRRQADKIMNIIERLAVEAGEAPPIDEKLYDAAPALLEACEAAHELLYHYDLDEQMNGVQWGDTDQLRETMIAKLWSAIAAARGEATQ